MKSNSLLNKATLTSLAFLTCCTASAQAPGFGMKGENKLTSSTTAPVSNWGFSKAHIAIRQLGEKNVVILFACEWKREPKAACDDYYFAEWRHGGMAASICRI